MRHDKLLAAAAAGVTFAFAVPVSAAVLVDSEAAGTEYVIDFAGQIEGTPVSGLSGLLKLTFTGSPDDGLTYNFNYQMLNDSSLVSRLSSFGFNTDPDLASANATGIFDLVGYDHNYPGFGKLDVCFRDAGGKCNGAGGSGGDVGGLFKGQSANGTLTLVFDDAQDSIELSEFAVRFQSIEGSRLGDSGIGLGTVVPPVPEPATWALMLLGFGAIGWGMRRRNSDDQLRMRVTYN